MAVLYSSHPGTIMLLEHLRELGPLATTGHLSTACTATRTDPVGNYWSHFLQSGSEVVTGGTFWVRKKRLVQRCGL